MPLSCPARLSPPLLSPRAHLDRAQGRAASPCIPILTASPSHTPTHCVTCTVGAAEAAWCDLAAWSSAWCLPSSSHWAPQTHLPPSGEGRPEPAGASWAPSWVGRAWEAGASPARRLPGEWFIGVWMGSPVIRAPWSLGFL